MTNKFKNVNGVWITKNLFFEMNEMNKDQVVFTLKDHDHRGFPSLYRLYMETDDVTEYIFANKHLGGWSHWTALQNCEWFKPYVYRWREELDLRTKANALVLIKEESKGGRNALAAAKYLMERGWEEKGAKKLKEETKEKVKQEADRIIMEKEDVQAAMDRIGLKVVN